MVTILEDRTLSARARWLRCAMLLALPVSAQVLTDWRLQHHGLLPCIFKKLTDLPCPLCGGTHAVHHLLDLDFEAAFQANPAVSMIVIALGLAGIGAFIEALMGSRVLRKAAWSRMLTWGVQASIAILMVHWLITLLRVA